jgi:hypothetical protein
MSKNATNSDQNHYWKVRRTSAKSVEITLPENMKFTDGDLTIDDVLLAIANYRAGKGDDSMGCCSGNTAIA